MQVHRIQNNNTSFQALKGFECSKNLKPIIGDAGDVIEQKLINAFNKHEYFQKLCEKKDVWVNIKPNLNETIKTGLDVEIYASKLNESSPESRENVISYVTVEIGKKCKYDYAQLIENEDKLQLRDLIDSYNSHAENIIQKFLYDADGLKSGVKKFLKINKRSK